MERKTNYAYSHRVAFLLLTLASNEFDPHAGVTVPFHHVDPNKPSCDWLVQVQVPQRVGVRVSGENLEVSMHYFLARI